MVDGPAKTLTIAGSDSGGAAGLQADLKTWTALGVYGMSAITAITAQSSVEVRAITYVTPELAAAQIEAVLSDYGAQAVKTGFIGRASLISAVAHTLARYGPFPLVVDPVLVNHRGEFMFDDEVLEAYRNHLLPMSDLITPNWREAALLSGRSPASSLSRRELEEIAAELHEQGAGGVLITGTRKGSDIVDYWFDGHKMHELYGPLLRTKNTHGSGDTLSAAICAFLARGDSMEAAIKQGRLYTNEALRRAVAWRLGGGHGPLSHFS